MSCPSGGEGRLEGIRALITGASRGVGRAIAEGFAVEGAELAVTATDVAHLASVVRSCAKRGAALHPHALDLRDPAAPARVGSAVLADMGGLDVLVNNAGILGVRAPLLETPPDLFDDVMRITVSGTLRMCQAVLPGMSDGGAIINVTSGAAGRAGWGAYAISRLSLNGMTDMLRVELEPRAIRCVAINPGPARTAMRAAAHPGEDPSSVPHPAALVGPFVAVAAGQDLGAGVVQASQWAR